MGSILVVDDDTRFLDVKPFGREELIYTVAELLAD